jgi:hypothetical protein
VIRYRIGLGAHGNRAAGRVKDILQAHGAVEAVFNPLPLAGGTDAEPHAVAKKRGPLIASAMDRAVSAEDLAAVALVFDGVARARVFMEGTHRRAIARVVVSGPNGTALDATMLSRLRQHLEARVPPGVAVTTENRQLVQVRARVLLRLEKNVDPMNVVRLARERLGIDFAVQPGLLDPRRVELDDDLLLSDVYRALEDVEGLHSAVVKELYRADGPLAERGLFDRIPTSPREMLVWARGARDGEEGVLLPFEEVADL